MARELIIMRHAKSDWHSNEPTDFGRPLNDRGKRDAPRMGEWMREQGIYPDYVISSPAKRAKQTCKRVCKALNFDVDHIHWQQRVYLADVEQLLQALAFGPVEEQRVLLVGHNPGLTDLIYYLLGDNAPSEPDGRLLPTATVVQIQISGSWQEPKPGRSKLLQLVRPRELAAKES
jgi:phosphohistidine phosphatase